jgi:hypothetical protein
MVLKGGILENKRRRKRCDRELEFLFFLERRIGKVGGTCNRKPHTMF